MANGEGAEKTYKGAGLFKKYEQLPNEKVLVSEQLANCNNYCYCA